MTRVLKLLALIPALIFSVAILYVGWLYLFSEKYDAKVERLNNTAQTLPKYGGEALTNKRAGDGVCTGSSDSSLPAINHMVKIDTNDYELVESQFYNETQRQGIAWDKKAKQSDIFEREGKEYQLQLTRYTSPAGYYGVNLTACN